MGKGSEFDSPGVQLSLAGPFSTGVEEKKRPDPQTIEQARKTAQALIEDAQDQSPEVIFIGKADSEQKLRTQFYYEARRESRYKKKKKIVDPPHVSQIDASGVSTVPGTLEDNVNWDRIGQILEEARKQGIWQPTEE